jgi:hypothetical protein
MKTNNLNSKKMIGKPPHQVAKFQNKFGGKENLTNHTKAVEKSEEKKEIKIVTSVFMDSAFHSEKVKKLWDTAEKLKKEAMAKQLEPMTKEQIQKEQVLQKWYSNPPIPGKILAWDLAKEPPAKATFSTYTAPYKLPFFDPTTAANKLAQIFIVDDGVLEVVPNYDTNTITLKIFLHQELGTLLKPETLANLSIKATFLLKGDVIKISGALIDDWAKEIVKVIEQSADPLVYGFHAEGKMPLDKSPFCENPTCQWHALTVTDQTFSHDYMVGANFHGKPIYKKIQRKVYEVGNQLPEKVGGSGIVLPTPDQDSGPVCMISNSPIPYPIKQFNYLCESCYTVIQMLAGID